MTPPAPRPAAAATPPPTPTPSPTPTPPPTPTVGSEITSAVQLLASLLGLGGYVYLIGGVVNWVRFGAARLPSDQATATLTRTQLFETGFRSVILMTLVFSLMCLLAWLAAGWRWSVNAEDWHDVISRGGVAPARAAVAEGSNQQAWQAHREHALHTLRARRAGAVVQVTHGIPGLRSVCRWAASKRDAHMAAAGERRQLATQRPDPVPANLGPAAVRVLAGFNTLVLSGALGLLAAQIVEGLFRTWWLVVAGGVLVALLVHLALLRWGPLKWPAWTHSLAWCAVVLVAVFVTAPIGLLLLAGFAVSLLGRPLGRLQRPSNLAQLLRSPLVWALFTFYALVALALAATPPVSFTRIVVSSGGTQTVGAYLSRADGGLYMVTCTPLADGTSTNERVTFVPDAPSTTMALGGELRLDSGQRPSLAAFAMGALGIGVHPPTWFRVDLRARRAACVGGPPEGLTLGTLAPALGSGVISGPGPSAAAHDGEAPMTRPPAIAQLARMYQPTLLATATDRFWPVSVGAVLRDRDPSTGQRTALCRTPTPGGAITCATASTLSSLVAASSSPNDYLRYPADLRYGGPTAQFQAFENGQSIDVGSLQHWLAHPDVLDPWYTAQIYFYYAGPIAASAWPAAARDPSVASGLIGLEYWFFYPFNYYPLVVTSSLMEDAPLAGDKLNVDLHQGDWEHIVVLLDPRTLTPLWLYTARHADEGQFFPWGTPAITLDGTHPVIQAAFGGHPSYPAYCQARPRVRVRNLSSDWLVCGSGRFAFRATSTPLVDLAGQSWACWKGHFGEAKAGLEVNAPGETDNPRTTARKFVYVAGPVSPLWQAENGNLSNDTGPCTQPGGLSAAETAAEPFVAGRLRHHRSV